MHILRQACLCCAALRRERTGKDVGVTPQSVFAIRNAESRIFVQSRLAATLQSTLSPEKYQTLVGARSFFRRPALPSTLHPVRKIDFSCEKHPFRQCPAARLSRIAPSKTCERKKASHSTYPNHSAPGRERSYPARRPGESNRLH